MVNFHVIAGTFVYRLIIRTHKTNGSICCEIYSFTPNDAFPYSASLC